jgi:hypothetical protein
MSWLQDGEVASLVAGRTLPPAMGAESSIAEKTTSLPCANPGGVCLSRVDEKKPRADKLSQTVPEVTR